METQNIVQRKYTPINGDFYEKLEVAATHNDRCELIYIDNEGNEVNTISRIDDLYTHDGVEYAVLEDVTIRLDQIKSLNGEREEDFAKRKKRFKEDFSHKFYSSGDLVVVDDNEYYTLTVNKLRNIIELRSHRAWETLEEIPELKSQLISIAGLLHDQYGLLNDFSNLPVNEEGVLEAPFMPARGILINAGLFKVADLLPLTCDTVVHNRGSFSVNSIKVRSFKDRYFAENWLSER